MIARDDLAEPVHIGVSWDGDALADPLVDEETVRLLLQRVLADHGRTTGQLLVAIVGDEAMHELNRTHLDHDYTTDVLSFNYGPDVDPDDRTIDTIDGEVIVNADHACRSGPEHDLDPAIELLLYCVHGTLHILGYDDGDDESRAVMEARQSGYLNLPGSTAGKARDIP
ncbi:MAG: rRNA maturation RNase YbeY [Planctomycetota bacterium]